MKKTTLDIIRNRFVLGLGILAMLVPSASAQLSSAMVQNLKTIHDFGQQLPPAQRHALSTGGANIMKIADQVARGHMPVLSTAGAVDATSTALAAAQQRLLTSSPTGGPVLVNAPELDYSLSRMGGFTQNETSSAWCGNNIVATYNDSGAFLRTVAQKNIGLAFNGVSVSHNGGQSFTPFAYLNAGSDGAVFLGGDPVVVCADPNTFYYASLYSRSPDTNPNSNHISWTGVSVSLSTDGGNSWHDPIVAVKKSNRGHFLDKEWIAVDPSNPRNMYITYTDFDLSFPTSGPCAGYQRIAIEMVASHNGGIGWSNPVVVEELCPVPFNSALQGSQVAVGPNGEVYVSWVFENYMGAQIRTRRSTDGGSTFSPITVVANATTAGLAGNNILQTLFRTNQFPTLAVDRSNGPGRGNVYISFTDGANDQIPEWAGFLGTYNFGDIVLTRSADGGQTWSTPTIVSPLPVGFTGPGRDQFMSGMGVDKRGAVGICYSDRRGDPLNNLVDHYCSVSTNQGVTFTETRQTKSSWKPTHLTDALINGYYMGDYDAVTTDNTGANAGFFNTFQVQTNGNPDVFATRFQ